MYRNSDPGSIDGASLDKKALLLHFWQKFISEFPTEADCVAELYRISNDGQTLHCRNCSSERVQTDYKERAGKCLSCSKEVWYTSDSYFDGIKKPTAWLGAIWLMERRIQFSDVDLARLANVAQSTVWNISKQIALIVNDRFEEGSSFILVPSELFEPAICKRSIETPAGQHPFAEQVEMKKREATNGESGPTDKAQFYEGMNNPQSFASTQLSGQDRSVYETLSNNELDLDELVARTNIPIGKLQAILTILEMDGLIERVPGGRYRCSSINATR